MTFVKGDPRINRNGREKGSKNKRTQWLNALQSKHPDVKEGDLAVLLYEIANNKELDIKERAWAIQKLTDYTFTKPTESIEIDQNITGIDVKELFKFKDDEDKNK